MQQKLALAVQEALRGSHQVSITFKEGATDRTIVRGIFYLFGMLEVGQILLSKEGQRILRVFLRSRKWIMVDGNRSMLLTFTNKLNKSWFVSKMHESLEQIEVVTDNKIEVVVSDRLNITTDKQIEAANN